MKTLLMTTAATLMIGGQAMADAHETSMGIGTVNVSPQDLFASDVIGMRLYAAETEIDRDGGLFNMDDGWEDIGEINDLIISDDGDVPAALVGVGGFLGIGEKDVAISMDQIAVYLDEDNERFLVIDTTMDALNAAPAFEMALDGSDMADADTDGMDDDMDGDVEIDAAATETDAMESDTIEADAEMVTDSAEADAVVAEDREMDADLPAGYVLEDYTSVAAMDLTDEDKIGAVVYDSTDTNIGEISEMVEGGFIVDVGGFLGLGEKPVVLPTDDVSFMREIDGDDVIAVVDESKESLEAMPEYED